MDLDAVGDMVVWRTASFSAILLVFAGTHAVSGDTGRGNDDKVRIPLRLPDNSDGAPAYSLKVEHVYTGRPGTSGTLMAPPSYPAGNYSLDATSYIFVLENTALEGTVELVVEDWDVHALSWITIRNSKYGGYIGRVLGRYDVHSPPPHRLRSPTCCLRIEFQTGCCAPAEEGFSGFRATYHFIHVPGGGRKASCEGLQVYSQLCNGECILEIYTCPCPIYGQYKCANGHCLTPEKACNGVDDCGDYSDERLCQYVNGQVEYEGMGSMYGFTVIISTVMSVVGTAFILVCAIRCVESVRSSRRKSFLRAVARAAGPASMTIAYPQVTWSAPEVVTLQASPVRVTPAGDFRCAVRSVALLTTGRSPSVSVRPLPATPPRPRHADVIDGDVANDDDDSDSASSHCESGFHGDDEGCVITSSSTSSSTSAAMSENEVINNDVIKGGGNHHKDSPKVKTKRSRSPRRSRGGDFSGVRTGRGSRGEMV